MLSNTIQIIISHYYSDANRQYIIDKIEVYQNSLRNSYGNEITDDLLHRITLAILKSSRSNLNRFESVMKLAEADWRDLLVGAGFGNSIEIHKKWEESILKKIDNKIKSK